MNVCLSGQYKEFDNWLKGIKGDIDVGTGKHANITYSQLVAAARNKY